MQGEKFKNVTVQLEPELLEKLDEKLEELDLNRSQFFRRLLKKDLGISSDPQQQLPLHEQAA